MPVRQLSKPISSASATSRTATTTSMVRLEATSGEFVRRRVDVLDDDVLL